MVLAAMVAASGCGVLDPADVPDAGGVDPGFDAGVNVGASADAGRDGGPQSTFHIQFDYRFDSRGFFSDAGTRALLERCARTWEARLASEFENVPAGTSVRTRNPEQPWDAGFSFDIEYGIDDVLVFVGSSPIPGGATALASPTAAINTVADPALRARLYARWDGDGGVFQPWTGWISFDSTEPWFFDPTPDSDDDVPFPDVDFISVALHELGHVLGVGISQRWASQINASGAFAGPKAILAHGAPVPLMADHGHVLNSVLWQGERVLMDFSDPPALRMRITPLDQALFEDLGYSFFP